MNMDLQFWLVLIVGGTCLSILGWISVQSLVQASLLRSWRRGSLAGLDGRAAALRGRVKVRGVVRIAHIGNCLWFRELVETRSGYGRRRSWNTESDTQTVADFSLVVGADEVRVAGEPTEIHGKESNSNTESPDVVNRVLGDPDERVTEEWLPVLEDLTIVGRLRRVGGGWEIGRDPVSGLLFATDVPTQAALNETLKGVFGLAGVAAGIGVIVWLCR
jgi:hypothetical protein